MSVAGLLTRGIRTKFLDSYIRREGKLQANAKADPRRCTQGLNCLTSCGLRDGLSKQGNSVLISSLLPHSVEKLIRVVFRKRPASFGNAIRTVRETIQYLLTGSEPVATLGR